MAVVLTLLVSCGQKKTVQVPTPPPSPKPVVVSEAQIEAELNKALAEDPRDTQAIRNDELADEADDIIAQYPDKNAADLLNTPEVKPSLMKALEKLGQDKALQGKINSTVELAAQMQGLSGEPGSVRLDMDISKYDDQRKSHLLQAVLSEDPKRIVGFLVEEIGEATPELSYGGVERASNGVAIKENQPPAK
ncbi:hypothetical protein EI77_02137 [Prosthecobacter fusiformis]|uniref:Uncharacterized protein n=1 Tax=Prosthecobacter fusiformis TaxID=48464 RepID=A0A4R7S029_9BACT|nr:hypothetical protein [Prosthecobacter fusiformis]TDU71019.1 hypothetical protein EI77_02137 [Prosthecobacter fusiformis]